MAPVIQLVSTALQIGPGPSPQVEPVTNPFINLVGTAVGAFLTTLIVGAILVAVAPDYTESKIATLMAEPVDSFVYGFVALGFLLVLLVLLVVTIIGILVAIPLALLVYLVWAVGASIAFLAIGDRLVDHADGWAKPLVVGATVNGGLTLTGIGGLVSLAIGAAGFGAVLRDVVG